MLLIITNVEDYSTYEVLDWLDYYDLPYFVLTDLDIIKVVEVRISNIKSDLLLEAKGRRFKFSELSKIWYRRGRINLQIQDFPSTMSKEFDSEIQDQLLAESKELIDFIWSLFRTKSINTQLDNSINKLEVLEACKRYGIRTPESLITTSKRSMLKLRSAHQNLISKNITQGVFMKYEGVYFGSHTIEIDEVNINKMAETFAPTLLQELIQKSFEVRSFYLNGKFYSSAILSQNDEQTRIDFRNYNDSKPNRTPPYQLPKELEFKLHGLMNSIGLNCGSIDLLVNNDGEYIFLEVNPIGQFKQVSYPCNYYLEKEIAKALKND